jgi:hypothetical protein
VPHCAQNRPLAGAPQFGQPTASAAPQDAQNRDPGAAAVPQAGQLKAASGDTLQTLSAGSRTGWRFADSAGLNFRQRQSAEFVREFQPASIVAWQFHELQLPETQLPETQLPETRRINGAASHGRPGL